MLPPCCHSEHDSTVHLIRSPIASPRPRVDPAGVCPRIAARRKCGPNAAEEARKCSNRVFWKSCVLWMFPGLGYALTSSRRASCNATAISSYLVDIDLTQATLSDRFDRYRQLLCCSWCHGSAWHLKQFCALDGLDYCGSDHCRGRQDYHQSFYWVS